LAANGHEIIGVEYVKEAIEQFFDENKIEYTLKENKGLKLYTVS
jgi:hypothetical protein